MGRGQTWWPVVPAVCPDVLCSLAEFLLASLEVAFSAGEGVDTGLVLGGWVIEGVGIEGVA